MVQDFDIQTITLNKSFSYYSIVMKLIFMILAIASYSWKAGAMQKITPEFYSPEQKDLKLLTICVILVNEPFTAHIFDNTLYTICQTTFFVLLSTMLLHLWLPLVYRLAGQESSVFDRSSKFIKRFLIIYFMVAWLTYVVLGTSVAQNPLADFSTLSNNAFNVLKISLYLTLLAGLIWSIFKTTSILKRWNDLTERDNRLFWFSVTFVVFIFYLIATGGLYYRNLDGTKLLLFPGLSALYVSAVRYLFIPTEEGIDQAQHLKKYDNPVAKAAYKDLEMSDEVPRKQQEIHPTGTIDTYHQLNHPTGNSKSDIDHAYPYESKRDEEF